MLASALSMIYSRWLPDKGGYEYFETSERLGLADDLPVPKVSFGEIGAASTSSGRPLPLGAKRIGYGKLARGSIVPFERKGLMGLGALSGPQQGELLAVALLGLFAGCFAVRAYRRSAR